MIWTAFKSKSSRVTSNNREQYILQLCKFGCSEEFQFSIVILPFHFINYMNKGCKFNWVSMTMVSYIFSSLFAGISRLNEINCMIHHEEVILYKCYNVIQGSSSSEPASKVDIREKDAVHYIILIDQSKQNKTFMECLCE